MTTMRQTFHTLAVVTGCFTGNDGIGTIDAEEAHVLYKVIVL